MKNGTKYIELSKKINEEILSRSNFDDRRLPTEKEFCKKYNVSRETIRKALKHLVDQKKIYCIQGSGYYIKKDRIVLKNSLNQLTSITNMIRNANLKERDMEVNIFVQKAKKKDRELLKLKKNDMVYVVERFRIARSEPVVYSRNIIPKAIVGDEFNERYNDGSLLNFIEIECGIQITDAVTEIQAVTKIESIPKHFINKNYPLLKFIQVHYSLEGLPIYLSYDYMRNDIIRVFVKRTKK